jgi:VWFA-related protein
MKRFPTAMAAMAGALLACALFANATARTQESQEQSSQQPAPQQTPTRPITQATQQEQGKTPGQINVTSALVVVPVTVKDTSGALVNNLLQQDFRLFEDGVEQKISLFALDPSPISSVVLLDNALSIKNSDDVRKSLRAIVGGFAPGDETTIIRFDHYPEESAGFISDPDQLLTKLSHVQLPGEFDAPTGQPILMAPMLGSEPAPGAPGVTQKRAAPPSEKCINDAVYAAAMLLRSRPKGRRRVIFLISDGEGSKGNTYNLNDTVKMLISSEVAVYSIGVGGSFLERGLNVISKLAHDSGGDVFYARGNNLEALYSRVEDQARNQYTLGYAPHHRDRVVTYHAVDVRVTRPGLTVYARQGYYSAPR